MPGQGCVGQRVGGVEVGGGADDAVELAAELHLATENPPMHGQVLRRFMGETDIDRLPVRTEQGGAKAVHHGNGQFDGLAVLRGRIGNQLLADDDRLAGFLNVDRQ
ncbi:hypothetical protein D3C76_754380 [compost metagenome]